MSLVITCLLLSSTYASAQHQSPGDGQCVLGSAECHTASSNGGLFVENQANSVAAASANSDHSENNNSKNEFNKSGNGGLEDLGLVSPETSQSPEQVQASQSSKSITLSTNGESEAKHVTIFEPQEGESFQSLVDQMADMVRANETLLPHQMEHGFGRPYRLYNSIGHVVKSWENITENSGYSVVPHGLDFMWPTVAIGHTVTLTDIKTMNGKPIILRTLNHSPRVFEIENLLTLDEADTVREAAMNVNHEGNQLQRSTTGHTGNVDPYRTSDNAFVHSESDVATNVTNRAFEVVRMKYDEELGRTVYDPKLADGLQVLRYNKSGGYRWHTDWFPEKSSFGRNYDVTKGGANRFATVLFYLSDVELGGQTGFPEAEGDTSQLDYSMSLAKDMFEQNSWEMQATRKCFGKFSVKPAKARAILFYSLHPNGRGDSMSMHTGCPVLIGTKWAANLWIWNKDRDKGIEDQRKQSLTATLVNSMDVPCLVSWVTNPRSVQGRLEPGQSMEMKTFNTDSFVFRDENRVHVLARWTADITKGERQTVYIQRGLTDAVSEEEEGDTWGPKTSSESIQLKVRNSYAFPVDIFWASDETYPVKANLGPNSVALINTFDTHSFNLYRAGAKEKERAEGGGEKAAEVLRSFTAHLSGGDRQYLILSEAAPTELKI
eukprot:CAMPEP_0184478348 /NCGR_PEP_ID=MMETSP0113_2-20130426/405_1 /TAXON_ID=91329 /ORGANISM="Norrisiella sphaerica, Strain BC52" /LENGTH=662 /DNA_ID=CAMNT_0026856109 /DNA_START=205 /DNA_END=2193 /DNA_ORIENTATION=+